MCSLDRSVVAIMFMRIRLCQRPLRCFCLDESCVTAAHLDSHVLLLLSHARILNCQGQLDFAHRHVASLFQLPHHSDHFSAVPLCFLQVQRTCLLQASLEGFSCRQETGEGCVELNPTSSVTTSDPTTSVTGVAGCAIRLPAFITASITPGLAGQLGLPLELANDYSSYRFLSQPASARILPLRIPNLLRSPLLHHCHSPPALAAFCWTDKQYFYLDADCMQITTQKFDLQLNADYLDL